MNPVEMLAIGLLLGAAIGYITGRMARRPKIVTINMERSQVSNDREIVDDNHYHIS